MNLTTDIGAYMHTMSPQQERRLFAALAMQGLLAHGTRGGSLFIHEQLKVDLSVAQMSIDLADDLLRELAKPVSP